MKLSKRRLKRLLAIMGVSGALGGAGLAYAHFGDTQGGEHGWGDRQGCSRGAHAQRHRSGLRFGKHVEGTLAFLKTELNISESQDDAWAAFADDMREIAKNHTEARSNARPNQLPEGATVVERLERHMAFMEKRMATGKQIIAAVTKLYPGLTPGQQKIADELLPLRRH